MLDIRAPYGIQGGDTCKYAICLQLACRMYNCPFNRTEALKLSGVDSEAYRHTYGVVLKTLDISPQINLESVGIHLGIPHLTPLATKILTKYKERVLKTIPDIQKPKVKFDSSPYVSVPFALATEFRAVKLDRNTLLDVTETSKKDFSKLYDHMNELVMLPIKNELQKVSLKKKTHHRKQSEETKETQLETNQEKGKEEEKTVVPLDDKSKDEGTTQKPEEVAVCTKRESLENGKNKEKEEVSSPGKPDLLAVDQKGTQVSSSESHDERLLQIAVDIWDFSKSEDGKAPVLPKIIAQRKKQKEFEEWKAKVLQSNTAETPSFKRKVQTTLDFVPSKKQKIDRDNTQPN
uniref:Uncharacterized protein n=1 Tax=Arcella intermedia TaxID=1963864 RepID=A0A6B2L7X0_9EUKA